MKRNAKLLSVAVVTLLAGCGSVASNPPGDASIPPADSPRIDSSLMNPRGDAGGFFNGSDSGPTFDANIRPGMSVDSGSGLPPAQGDSGPSFAPDAGSGAFDAGYYRGDGSYFVDGGAFPDAASPSALDASTAGAIDASSGCNALAACCSTLTSPSQGLCTTVAGLGNATNCATELAELQSGGSCTGQSVLASQIQVPPSRMVSDGATLFWTTAATPGLLAMPVGGGSTATLLAGMVNSDFLAVDDTNVYVIENGDLARIPKNGSAPSLISTPGHQTTSATTLGGTIYWMECCGEALLSAPMKGGAATVIAQFTLNGYDGQAMGVTSSTVFFGGMPLTYFPLTGLPPQPDAGTMPGDAGGPVGSHALYGPSCQSLASDTNAVYCAQASTGSNVAVASNGTSTPLGSAVNSSYIVFDDAYAYWADATSVGTIMRAPKAGGGAATVLARDTSPLAIAVDARSVYWSDAAGFIKSIAK